MGGREMALNPCARIQNGSDGRWTASDVTDTPMGQVTDTATLEKGTLTLRKRSVKQGPATINVDFAGNKATGTMNMNGQDKPIAADLGGPVFAETSSPQSIACLPLAEGYSATFRNFDLRKQKEKLLQLKVVGLEHVTVPPFPFTPSKFSFPPPV